MIWYQSKIWQKHLRRHQTDANPFWIADLGSLEERTPIMRTIKRKKNAAMEKHTRYTARYPTNMWQSATAPGKVATDSPIPLHSPGIYRNNTRWYSTVRVRGKNMDTDQWSFLDLTVVKWSNVDFATYDINNCLLPCETMKRFTCNSCSSTWLVFQNLYACKLFWHIMMTTAYKRSCYSRQLSTIFKH